MSKPRITPDIRPDEPLNKALKKIIRARARELKSFAAGARRGLPGPVHDMRVACRRLLSVLKMFKGAARVKGGRQLKEIFRALRDVRECDVFINLLDKFAAGMGGGESAASERLRIEYTDKRKSAGSRLEHVLAVNDLKALE